jgi:hypothetical protein
MDFNMLYSGILAFENSCSFHASNIRWKNQAGKIKNTDRQLFTTKGNYWVMNRRL